MEAQVGWLEELMGDYGKIAGERSWEAESRWIQRKENDLLYVYGLIVTSRKDELLCLLSKTHRVSFLFFFFFNVFLFGYTGSSLLCAGFLSLQQQAGVTLWLQDAGFSLQWLLLSQDAGSRVGGGSSAVTARRLSGPAACGIFSDQTWDRTCILCIGRWILNH